MEKSSENIVYVSKFVDLVGPETECLALLEMVAEL